MTELGLPHAAKEEREAADRELDRVLHELGLGGLRSA